MHMRIPFPIIVDVATRNNVGLDIPAGIVEAIKAIDEYLIRTSFPADESARRRPTVVAAGVAQLSE